MTSIKHKSEKWQIDGGGKKSKMLISNNLYSAETGKIYEYPHDEDMVIRQTPK